MSRRRRPASSRWSTGSTCGLESLLKGRKVTVVTGHGHAPARRPHRAASPTAPSCAARNVLIATGSSPRALADRRASSSTADRAVVRPRAGARPRCRPRVAVDRRRRDRMRVRVVLRRRRGRGDDPRSAAADPAGVDQQVAQTRRRARSRSAASRSQTGVQVSRPRRRGGDLRFDTDKNGDEQLVGRQGRRVASGAGRAARTSGSTAAGVKVDERGYVVVDGNMRTSVDGVYAVGDVVATPQLAHVAFSEAIVAIKTMLGEDPLPDRIRQGAVGYLLPSRGRRSAGSPRSRRRSAGTTS